MSAAARRRAEQFSFEEQWAAYVELWDAVSRSAGG
jgi:hypothetical protein